ncbi:MAG: hypothetical protein M1840_008789 [Geoglossum simile]|nr:MAG: hypothetical protein M1840_008789 [Geoglossum simile]
MSCENLHGRRSRVQKHHAGNRGADGVWLRRKHGLEFQDMKRPRLGLSSILAIGEKAHPVAAALNDTAAKAIKDARVKAEIAGQAAADSITTSVVAIAEESVKARLCVMVSDSRRVEKVVNRGTTAPASQNTFRCIRAGNEKVDGVAQGYPAIHCSSTVMFLYRRGGR